MDVVGLQNLQNLLRLTQMRQKRQREALEATNDTLGAIQAMIDHEMAQRPLPVAPREKGK